MIAAVIPYAGEPVEILGATLASVGKHHPDTVALIVVVADGCDLDEESVPHDGYAEGFHVVRLPERSGCPAAMNAGIRYAADLGATRIGRCDTADEWTRAMGDVLESDHPATFGPSQLGVFDGWSSRIWYDNQFQASCTAFDVSAWEKVGGYDESLRFADDWDFHAKVHRAVGWTREWTGPVARVDASGISAPGNAEKEAARNRDTAIVAKRAQKLRRAS